jgi:hypothetical protein
MNAARPLGLGDLHLAADAAPPREHGGRCRWAKCGCTRLHATREHERINLGATAAASSAASRLVLSCVSWQVNVSQAQPARGPSSAAGPERSLITPCSPASAASSVSPRLSPERLTVPAQPRHARSPRPVRGLHSARTCALQSRRRAGRRPGRNRACAQAAARDGGAAAAARIQSYPTQLIAIATAAMAPAGFHVGTAVKVQPAECLRPCAASPALPPGHFGQFAFDCVLGEDASQREIYEELVRPYLDAFLEVGPLGTYARRRTARQRRLQPPPRTTRRARSACSWRTAQRRPARRTCWR